MPRTQAYKILFYKTRPPHESEFRHMRLIPPFGKAYVGICFLVGLNYGVLIAIIAVALVGNFVFLAVERRREQKEMNTQQKSEKQ